MRCGGAAAAGWPAPLMAALPPELPQAGNVCLVARDGRVHLQHCITGECKTLPQEGRWDLVPGEAGDVRLVDAAGTRATTTARQFSRRVLRSAEGQHFIIGGEFDTLTPLGTALAEHEVVYTRLPGLGGESAVLPFKVYLLKRPARGARVFLEMQDVAAAVGAHLKKGQQGSGAWQPLIQSGGLIRGREGVQVCGRGELSGALG